MAKTKPVKKKTPTVKKKPAASTKKSPVKKGTDSVRVKLAKELVSLVPKLDSEGLAFLIKQARIHLYNMQVDELGRAAIAVNTGSARSKAIKGVAQKTRTQSSKSTLKIESTGTGYYMRFNNSGTMFSKQEMVQLVRLVNSSSSQTEIGSRLHSWFQNERRDIFQLIPISDSSDKILVNIAGVIKKNFKLKK
jgi:hypothetical protein